MESQDTKSIECKICTKDFANVFELELHFNVKHPEENSKNVKELIQCEYCDLSFRPCSIKNHLDLVHEGTIEKIKCKYCFNSFTKHNLKKHISRVHEESKNIFKRSGQSPSASTFY